jgi:membrane protein required for colicin V production
MELANIAGIFLGIWIAIKFSGKVEIWLKTNQEITGWWIPFLAFFIVFAGVYAAAFFGGKALSAALKLMMLGMVNRIAGGITGLFKMLMMISVAFVLLKASGAAALSDTLEKESTIHKSITSVVSWFYPEISNLLPKKVSGQPSDTPAGFQE